MKQKEIPLSLRTPSLAQAQINRIRTHLGLELNELRKELKHLPQGRLYIKRTRKWISFYVFLDGRTSGITKDKTRVYQLARRQYITLVIRYIDSFLDDLVSFMDSARHSQILAEFDALFERFENAGLDLNRITMTPNQYIWNSDRESKKTNRREELIYPTVGRVFMRTKSEQMLGNLLERLHIPYRYESRLHIGGINYHPDFLIMLPSGRLIIIEHAGRLDLHKYNDDLIQRLQAYSSIGLLIGRDIFFTFELDTRDESIAKEILFQALVSTPSDSTFLRKVAEQAGCVFK